VRHGRRLPLGGGTAGLGALFGLVMTSLGCYEPPPARPSALALHEGPRPVLESSPAIQYLPAQTELVVGARTLEVAERTHVLAALEAHTTASGSSARDVLTRAGIDPTHPVGGFVVDPNHRVVGAFGRVADRERIEGFIGAEAKARGEVPALRVHGDGVVVSGGERSSWRVVIRDDSAFFLWSRRDPSLLDAAARSIASSEPSRGLAGSLRYRVLLRELEGGSDVAVFVRSASLLQRALGIWDRQADRIFGSLPGAAAGIDIVGGHAVIAGFIAVRPDSLLDRAQGGSRGEVAWFHAAGTASPISLSGWFRRDRVGELVRGILSMTPDPIEAEAKLEEKVGEDLDARVFPELSGELGLTWSPSGWAAFATIAPDGEIDLSPAAPRVTGEWAVEILEACPRRGERCLAMSGGSAHRGLLGPAPASPPELPPRTARGVGWWLTVDLNHLWGSQDRGPSRALTLVGRRSPEGIVLDGSFPLREVSAGRSPLGSGPGSR
jgi:hypothetical protein